MSAAEIVNLSQTISQFGASLEENLDKSEDARDRALTLHDRMRDVTAVVEIHFDSFTGDDANDGSDWDNSVASLSRVIELMDPTSLNLLRVNGELVIDLSVDIETPPRLLYILKRADGPHAKIRLIEASNLANSSGMLGLFMSAATVVQDVEIILDSPNPGALLTGFFAAYSVVHFENCTYSQTARNVAHLLDAGNGYMRTKFINSPISAISGNVFVSVTAGSNPNAGTSSFSYKSNLSAG